MSTAVILMTAAVTCETHRPCFFVRNGKKRFINENVFALIA